MQVLHRALVNFLVSMRQQPGLTAEDTLLAVTTLSFDIAALELFLPLIVGARLVVAGRDVVANGTALAAMLARFRVTVMQATPVTWRILLAAGWQGNHQLKILCGGEALPLELAQQLLPKSASLWNMYGPTETTIWSTICKIEAGAEVVSIGRPIANTQVYLLDTQLRPVPIGVAGELYIGGAGLARGYLNRPELTNERFIAHPFSDEPAARLYNTGDLARYRTDGTIEMLGRLDQQVKLRGFRIELGEIEAVLNQHPALRQSLVMLREDTPGDKQLVAYVVSSEQHLAAVDELRRHLMQQLPAYMLPSAFVTLDALPLTPNGKIDRKALPSPEPVERATGETFVPPTLTVHYQLIQIWEELLNTRPIGIQDNFFYLGGHSLLAARLITRVEQVFKKKIPFATLFARPTIEQLSAVLQEENSSLQTPLGKEESKDRVPVVAIQTNEARRPFFFLHGNWDSNSFYCFALARDLGSDQPFYVLEPYKFDGLAAAPSYKALAAAHIAAMRAVQPEGPYLLGGFCNGGVIAFEMAQQLHAQGQVVDLLALIEPGIAPRTLKLARSFIQCIGSLARLGPDRQLDWFLHMRHALRFMRHVLSFLSERNWGLLPLFSSTEALRQDGTGIYAWVAAAYTPRQYPGKVTFFWASEKRDSRRALWGDVNTQGENEGEAIVIPGEHFDLILDNLNMTSAQLRMCVEKAQRVPM